jgi:catechol 2,3-dioxygenase-like lactoylglutathione lyase family enzyme
MIGAGLCSQTDSGGERTNVIEGARRLHPLTPQEKACQNQRMLTLGVVAIGVSDVDRAASFWSMALGYEVRRDGFGGWPTVLSPPGGSGTSIALQPSGSPLQAHPRIHLDLHVADVAEQAAEVRRLVALGAEEFDWDSYPEDSDFVVLADPDGNRFCIVDLSHERLEGE